MEVQSAPYKASEKNKSSWFLLFAHSSHIFHAEACLCFIRTGIETVLAARPLTKKESQRPLAMHREWVTAKLMPFKWAGSISPQDNRGNSEGQDFRWKESPSWKVLFVISFFLSDRAFSLFLFVWMVLYMQLIRMSYSRIPSSLLRLLQEGKTTTAVRPAGDAR